MKSATVASVEKIPRHILGAAWQPQLERMQAGIYFPLFLVLASSQKSAYAIYYLSADLQRPEMFKARKPLAATARRAGWTGFVYDLSSVRSALVRLK